VGYRFVAIQISDLPGAPLFLISKHLFSHDIGARCRNCFRLPLLLQSGPLGFRPGVQFVVALEAVFPVHQDRRRLVQSGRHDIATDQGRLSR
jgi:hypothetical protein